MGARKSRLSSAALNVKKQVLAVGANQGSVLKTKVNERATGSNSVCNGGNNGKRGHVNVIVSKPVLIVTRVDLAVGPSRPGCRGGLPDASRNSEHSDWCNNQVDSHLQAAPEVLMVEGETAVNCLNARERFLLFFFFRCTVFLTLMFAGDIAFTSRFLS